MADVVSSETRSRMMSGIRGKHTIPEMLVRKALFASGYRFRLHRKDLPGKPDIVLPKFKAVVLVHGCFWHMHRNCRFATMPATRPEFWTAKLEGNARRDELARSRLVELGWRVLTVWECYLRATPREILQADLARWISGAEPLGEFSAGQTAKA